jgi:hypothetical protein
MYMSEDHFPDFFRQADEHSDRWQRLYLGSERAQLVSLLAAAAASAVGLGSVAVVVFFAIAIAAQVFRLSMRPDQKWWNGRAGAESAKTAAWRYVVGGLPFDLENSNADVDLAGRVSDIASEVADLVPVSSAGSPVTSEMREMRSRPLPERISIYHRERIQGQQTWYSSKSRWNAKRATRWSIATIAAQGLGLILGILAAVNDWQLDPIGFLSALSAAAVAWMAVKQYEILARSYAVASNELGTIDVQIQARSWNEEDWATFVNEAEEAISREHTSWRASRAV